MDQKKKFWKEINYQIQEEIVKIREHEERKSLETESDDNTYRKIID